MLEIIKVQSGGLIEIMAPAKVPLTLPPELSEEQVAIQQNLEKHVKAISHDIGPRHTGRLDALEETAQYIEGQFQKLEVEIDRLEYTTFDGHTVRNVECLLPGSGSSSLVIGAHYDSVNINKNLKKDCPGANDNGSAVAVLLEMGRMLSDQKDPNRHTVRLVAFANEEPPYFAGDDMGSFRHAYRLKSQKEHVIGMVCLETVGYYSNERGSQIVPPPVSNYFNHNIGNFVTFMGDRSSADLLKTVLFGFAEQSEFPCVGLLAETGFVGLQMSDQISFWKQGFKAIMVTDTVFMRTPKPYTAVPTYHTCEDTWEKLNYGAMAQVADGLTRSVLSMIRE